MPLGLNTLHEKGWFKSLTAIVSMVVGVLAIITALSSHFHHKPDGLPAKNVEGTAVAAAALDDATAQQIMQQLGSKDLIITVVCVRQDPKAARFAQALKSFLEEQGYQNVGLAYTGMPASFHGVEIQKEKNRAFIKVGH